MDSRIFLIILIGVAACSSDFEKGEDLMKSGEYDAARSSFNKVPPGNVKYADAQIKIKQMDTICSMQYLEAAITAYNDFRYDSAKFLFYKSMISGRLGIKARQYLVKIDSIDSSLQIVAQNRLEAEKIEKMNSLKHIKGEAQSLFRSLLKFKDKGDFKYYGFGVGYKYNKWLLEVKRLKVNPENLLLLECCQFSLGDIEMLGLEYAGSRGEETEYSRWARKTISDGLKKE